MVGILDLHGERVQLDCKDCRDGRRNKVLSLAGDEFIRRFLLHVLPKGFLRSTAPTKRRMLASLGKMPTTSVRRGEGITFWSRRLARAFLIVSQRKPSSAPCFSISFDSSSRGAGCLAATRSSARPDP